MSGYVAGRQHERLIGRHGKRDLIRGAQATEKA